MQRIKKFLQKNWFFFLRLVLVWEYLITIGFAPHAHSVRCRGREKSKFDPYWKSGMRLGFMAHNSIKNGQNFILRVPLESPAIQLHAPCTKISISILESVVISQKLTLDWFFSLLMRISINSQKSTGLNFENL